jgi:DNA-binding beta-propeller fold protein YncE
MSLLIISCGDKTELGTDEPKPSINNPPIANAGQSQLVEEHATVSLSGSGTDSDGTIVKFHWLQTKGPDVFITNKTEAIASFIAPETNESVILTFELTVTDNDGDTTSSSIDVEVIPHVDDLAPVLDIIFPIHNAVNDNKILVVRGLAHDESEVLEVQVNGTIASLTPLSQKDDLVTYSWQAEITPKLGETFEINVSSEDINGNMELNAAQNSLSTPYALSRYFLGTDENTLIAIDEEGQLYSVNKDTLTFEKILKSDHLPGGFTHVDAVNKKLITVSDIGENVTINRIELEGPNKGNLEVVYQGQFQPIEGGISDTSYSQSRNTLAMSINSNRKGETILEFNFDTNTMRTLFSNAGVKQKPNELAYINEYLYVYNHSWSGRNTLTAINTESLIITDITEVLSGKTWVSSLISDEENNLLYIFHMEGVDLYSIESNEVMTVSTFENQKGMLPGSYDNVLYDNYKKRFLIHESSVNALFEIDLVDSGRIKQVYSNGRGQGPRLGAVREIVLSEDQSEVYAFAFGAIFGIDISTGNRRIITELPFGRTIDTHDMVLDKNHNRLLLTVNNQILEVEIATGKYAIFASNMTVSDVEFDDIYGLALDNENNLLYVTDTGNSNIIAIDLSTKKRTIISSEESEGGYLSAIRGIALNSEENVLYVMSQSQSNLYQINIKSGARKKILDECIDEYSDLLGPTSLVSNIYYDAIENNIYMNSGALLKYDLNENICKVSKAGHTRNVVVNSKGQLFGVRTSEIKQIDFESGNEVLVSKI